MTHDTELPNDGKHRDKVHLITWFLTRRKKATVLLQEVLSDPSKHGN